MRKKMCKLCGYLACMIGGIAIGLLLNFGNGKTGGMAVSEFHAKADSASKVTLVLKDKDKAITAIIKKKEKSIQEKIDSAAVLPDSIQIASFNANSDSLSVLASISSIRKANIAFVELEATKSLLLDVKAGYENRGKIISAQEDEIINLRGENQALVEDLEREKKKVKIWKYVAVGALIVGLAL